MSDMLNNPPPKLHKVAASAVRPTKFSSWRDHFASERRWFADTFSGEKMIEMLKQLAWVVPLTLLIWVYAEREQVTKEGNETIPFELVSSDPNRLVTLKPPQDSNVVVELEGPRARVQDVLHRLRGGEFPQGLRIEVDRALEANRDHQVPTIALIANHDLFRRNGITITRTQPDTINVTVDAIIDREARVVPAPGTPNLLEGTKFDPPTVKVRGPFNVLQPATEGGSAAPLVAYAHIPPELLTTPGTRDADDLMLSLPPPLNRDTRVTLIPAKVNAALEVRASDAEWDMPAMTISLDVPKTVADKYTVRYNTSLANVKLIGPKDVIDAIQTEGGPKPYAQLKVTIDDATAASSQDLRRKLRFVDLPRGVRVSEKDEQREVPFQLVPKSDAEQ
jgi:hypothetical protein